MKRPLILLVDDDPDVLGVVDDYLAGIGYAVEACANGRCALDRLSAENPGFDAAVIDWTLPDLPGRTVVRAFSARLPGRPIIITTGHGAEVLSDVADAAVAATVLRKPFTMRALSMRLDAALSKG